MPSFQIRNNCSPQHDLACFCVILLFYDACEFAKIKTHAVKSYAILCKCQTL